MSFLTLAGHLGVPGFTPALASLWTLPSKPPYLMDLVIPVPTQYQASPTFSVPGVCRYGSTDVTYSAVDDEDQHDSVPTVSPR